MMNKRGTGWADFFKWGVHKGYLVVLGLVILAALIMLAVNNLNGLSNLWNEAQSGFGLETIGGMPDFAKYFNYIVGTVPSKLISSLGDVTAMIVYLVIFAMLVLSFGDIMHRFSLFSPAIAWILGILLAVVAANVKLVALIAIISFSLVATAGVVAVAFGLLAPFVIFACLNFLILRPILALVKDKDAAKNLDDHVKNIDLMVTAADKVANTFRRKPSSP